MAMHLLIPGLRMLLLLQVALLLLALPSHAEITTEEVVIPPPKETCAGWMAGIPGHPGHNGTPGRDGRDGAAGEKGEKGDAGVEKSPGQGGLCRVCDTSYQDLDMGKKQNLFMWFISILELELSSVSERLGGTY